MRKSRFTEEQIAHALRQVDVGLLRDGTPPLQKHSPPAPRRRDVPCYLALFSVLCPAFCPGLRRARYESPSMTRS